MNEQSAPPHNFEVALRFTPQSEPITLIWVVLKRCLQVPCM